MWLRWAHIIWVCFLFINFREFLKCYTVGFCDVYRVRDSMDVNTEDNGCFAADNLLYWCYCVLCCSSVGNIKEALLWEGPADFDHSGDWNTWWKHPKSQLAIFRTTTTTTKDKNEFLQKSSKTNVKMNHKLWQASVKKHIKCLSVSLWFSTGIIKQWFLK